MSEMTLALWRSAPLDARLRFASELLPVEDPLQGALKEAIGVVQLWRRGPELEGWAKAYPSLLVDTAAALAAPETAEDEAHIATAELLREARGLLDSSLRAFGFEWLRPNLGDPPSQDCLWVGEGAVVASCVRPGLRYHGTLLLPAEVRLGDGAAREAASGGKLGAISSILPIESSPDSPHPRSTPDWLRALQQRGVFPYLSALETLAAAGGAADDGRLAAAVEGLREALDDADAAPSLQRWLKDELNVDILLPHDGDPFDPLTMQARSERRTVHEHEADTVARLERAGFTREGRVLAPAEVVRYVAGEAW